MILAMRRRAQWRIAWPSICAKWESWFKFRDNQADQKLLRRTFASCAIALPRPIPAVALSDLLNSFGEAETNLETPEQIYAAERAPIDAFRVIPLVHVSESYGLSPQVRDWMAPRWGGWRLEDVWLEQAPAAGGTPQ